MFSWSETNGINSLAITENAIKKRLIALDSQGKGKRLDKLVILTVRGKLLEKAVSAEHRKRATGDTL